MNTDSPSSVCVPSGAKRKCVSAEGVAVEESSANPPQQRNNKGNKKSRFKSKKNKSSNNNGVVYSLRGLPLPGNSPS